MRGYLYDAAWWAGWFDGLANTYDSRPFAEHSLFTAYEHGRATGLSVVRAWEIVAEGRSLAGRRPTSVCECGAVGFDTAVAS